MQFRYVSRGNICVLLLAVASLSAILIQTQKSAYFFLDMKILSERDKFLDIVYMRPQGEDVYSYTY